MERETTAVWDLRAFAGLGLDVYKWFGEQRTLLVTSVFLYTGL